MLPEDNIPPIPSLGSSQSPSQATSENDLKRRYLELLPPQQIIQICLDFEAHVPLTAKTGLWPDDLAAAIAALLPKNSTPSSEVDHAPPTPSPDQQTRLPPEPPQISQQPIEVAKDAQPPDKAQTHLPPDLTPQQSSSPSVSIPPQPHPPQFPPQPYGYPPTQHVYPHNPYYHPPTGYAPYGHVPYSPYPSPHGYMPPPPPPSTFPHPMFNLPHQNQPVEQQQHAVGNGNGTGSSDDLPSYEQMIVEALMDCGDPEGCAPKDLFTWMASRYPLQSNFRPSASQALQKAFKRGRFEKGTGGKYRLSMTWEGGNTSRRTTRRPATQSHTPNQAPLTAPFTHAPLHHPHHHHHSPPQQSGPQQYAYGFPYGPSPLGYPPPPQGPQHTPSTEDKEAATNYEATQHILKSINFDSLLQLTSEMGGTHHAKSPAGPISGISESLPSALAAPTTTATLPTPHTMPSMPTVIDQSLVNNRAQLQVQLAALAMQLADLATENDARIEVTQPPAPPDPRPVTPNPADIEDSDDDDDMEEITF